MVRLGVFICHCGKNIAGAVDVKELVKFAKEQPEVFYAKDNKFLCSEQGQELMEKAIGRNEIERVVVAACGADLHGETFKSLLCSIELEPEYLAMVNIRKHTMGDAGRSQSAQQIRFACENDLSRTIKRLRLKKVPKKVEVSLNQEVAVLGAGIAGIEAALDLAEKDYQVHLIEQKPVIGGAMALLYKVYPTDDCASCILAPKLAKVMNHPNVFVYTQARVNEFKGYIGNFELTLSQKPFYVDLKQCTGCGACEKVCPIEITDMDYTYSLSTRKAIFIPYPQAVPHKAILDIENCTKCGECVDACKQDAISISNILEPNKYQIKVGAVIVATGFNEFNPNTIQSLGYQKHPDIITQRQLIRLLDIDGPTKGRLLRPSNNDMPKNIVMLQCVGSRDRATNITCSGGVCCMAALKHAQLIKHEYPDINVYISMIDMRAYGKGFEEYYQSAMDAGVKFIRGRFAEIDFTNSDKNQENKDDLLSISLEDISLNELIQISAGLIVLSTAMVPPIDNEFIAKMLGIRLGPDGFFQEAHAKLRPVDTNVRGIFIAGSCRGPTDIPTSIIQAKAAASEVDSELRKKTIKLPENFIRLHSS